ncbi:RsmF rRNA methyltransferase first C-terminal domain-containing protein [Ligilactobacillus salivarius]|uniref:RsmB/NOP family class I SAM-dependent RNA methyltransferase n=1 Tax=Ligilactobacillus salivarius TaxID=1624 RepID=UPI003F27A1F3
MDLPKDFIEKYQNLLGDEAEDFLASLDEKSVIGFRLNPLKRHYKDVDYDLTASVPFAQDGFIGKVSGRSLEHQAGYVYSQDLSAMYVAAVANAQPGDKVLDLCAAPGGKSTQLAEQLNNQGLLVSNEINTKRAKILAENMERIGAKNVIITNESPDNLAKVFRGYFDKIVVDAPCSGEGMFRKDHSAVKYWHKDYPDECAHRQKLILEEAMKMLKTGGELVYSTCTFAPEEDEQIVAWLLENYDLTLEPITKYDGMDSGRPEFADGNKDLAKTIRLMPHHFEGEGQFLAKLKFNGEAASVAKKKAKKKKKSKTISADELDLWHKFVSDFSSQELNFADQDLRINGDYLYYYNKDWIDINKLKYIRPGLMLGTFKKNRFEPSYALALAVQEAAEENVIELSKDQWAEYVAGSTIFLSGNTRKNGWYLLRCEEKNFAFGKLVNGTIKNFFPKGLRFQA